MAGGSTGRRPRGITLDQLRSPLVRAHTSSRDAHQNGVAVTRDWIDEGLRHRREREEQQRLASERRLHQTAVIKAKGPDLMRRLVAEVGAVVDEYRRRSGAGGDEIEFEALPREGFCITRIRLPRVGLECHPDYELHVVYCNMTRADTHESETRELVFNLDMAVDDSDRIGLRHETRTFQALDEVVEFLLKPVLFPPLDQDR